MSDRDLDELLARIPVPSYDVRDDVARGVTRLRRRNVTFSATGLVLTATVGIALVLQGGHGTTADPGFAAPTSPAAPASPSQAREPRWTPPPRQGLRSPSAGQVPERPYGDAAPVLRGWRDVLAEHLGDQVRWARNSQSGGTSLGSKYDWAGGGMLELMVGSRWDDIESFVGFTAERRSIFRGLEARTWTDGSDLLVSVKHRDGAVVSLYASTSFGNNGTSTASLGLSRDDLLDAAADPRLQLPAAE